MKLVVSIIAVLIAAAAFCSRADVTVSDDIDNYGFTSRFVQITGTIKEGDSDRLARALIKPKNGLIAGVKLASLGGDVDEALKMGNIIYLTDYGSHENIRGKTIFVRSPPFVFVPGGGLCASACVLIYASAIDRGAFGDLVVHNPYMTSADMDYSEIKSFKDRIRAKALSQITRVGVSDQLWTIMTSTPSSQGRPLTSEELINLGLGTADPNFQDYEDGINAMKFGYTKSDYIQRKGQAEDCVKKNRQYNPDDLWFQLRGACQDKFGVNRSRLR